MNRVYSASRMRRVYSAATLASPICSALIQRNDHFTGNTRVFNSETPDKQFLLPLSRNTRSNLATDGGREPEKPRSSRTSQNGSSRRTKTSAVPAETDKSEKRQSSRASQKSKGSEKGKQEEVKFFPTWLTHMESKIVDRGTFDKWRSRIAKGPFRLKPVSDKHPMGPCIKEALKTEDHRTRCKSLAPLIEQCLIDVELKHHLSEVSLGSLSKAESCTIIHKCSGDASLLREVAKSVKEASSWLTESNDGIKLVKTVLLRNDLEDWYSGRAPPLPYTSNAIFGFYSNSLCSIHERLTKADPEMEDKDFVLGAVQKLATSLLTIPEVRHINAIRRLHSVTKSIGTQKIEGHLKKLEQEKEVNARRSFVMRAVRTAYKKHKLRKGSKTSNEGKPPKVVMIADQLFGSTKSLTTTSSEDMTQGEHFMVTGDLLAFLNALSDCATIMANVGKRSTTLTTTQIDDVMRGLLFARRCPFGLGVECDRSAEVPEVVMGKVVRFLQEFQEGLFHLDEHFKQDAEEEGRVAVHYWCYVLSVSIDVFVAKVKHT